MTIVISTEDNIRFQTLAGLKDSISARLDRTFGDDDLNDFIYLAEREMERILPVAARELTTALTINSRTVALPTDFKAVRHIKIDIGREWPLSLTAPSSLQSTSGIPDTYSVIAGQLWISPVPAGSYSGTLVYERKITPLTETAPSNWILAQHPDAYFYGALVQAADFIEDVAKIGRYRSMFETVIEQMIRESVRFRESGAPLKPVMIGVV